MIRPVDRSVLTPLSGAAGGSTSADIRAARFEEALAQAAGASNASEVKAEASDGLPLQPQMLIAADDTWVEVVATVEELGNPALPRERKHMLLQSLAENWQSFQSQSESIARLLEDYVGRESTAARSHTASGRDGRFNVAAMTDPAKPISDF